MAIQKTKELKNGVSGEYWRITRVHIDVNTLLTTLDLSLYLDKTSSDAGKAPISRTKSYKFVFTRDELLGGNFLALGYQKILDKANSVVPPLFPKPGDPDLVFDPDLAGGSIVA